MQFFLPPSGYLHPNEEDDHHRHQEQTTTTALPESKTPLSVLCVSTNTTIELYLHGRYRLLELDLLEQPGPVAMSHDLSYLLVAAAAANEAAPKQQQQRQVLSLFHLPFLKQDRYPLQIVASLHASITAHVATLQQTILESFNSWKTSLKPLDAKLQPLHRLLANYGVDDQPLGVILKQYILVGHTSESSSVANAIDQFFTGIQMNDQLLQRMEGSLHSALANVEGQARKGLLSPTQALCYQVQELAGYVRFHDTTRQNEEALQDLLTATHQLWISVHSLLLSMVQGRLHVRDFCAWLRSAGSQIKARGTALNSVQRENAKKRRVPQAVLERLLGTMNTLPIQAGASLSEHLLKINTSVSESIAKSLQRECLS
jgi:Anaphase-promoting complex, cyclosome, subunit 4